MLLINLSAIAQDRYVIQLTDKNNSPYSLSNPIAFLTQRSIDRRTKQGIAIDSMDLPVNPNYINGINATGAAILNVSKWLNTITIQTADPNVLNAINLLPYVQNTVNVGKPAIAISGADKKPKDKFEIEKSSTIPYATLNKTTSLLSYGYSEHQIKMLNGDVLHDAGFQGDGMMISMMDAGYLNAQYNPCFDSLHLQNKIIATKNFASSTPDVYTDHWHGAMCFSILAANLPGNIIGTCPHADYLLLETEETPGEHVIEEYNWASGAEFADSIGADVFSTSLGYTVFDDPTQNHTYATLDGNTAPMTIAADIAASRGIVVINSAGNEGNNSAWDYHFSVPSDAHNILSIGAVDSAGNYASFSGKGPTFDGRVKPDVSALGQGTYYCSPFDSLVYSGSGTSFSGPVVAGLAACLWQKFPTLTAMQIVDAIRRSASIYNTPDSLIGYGIPDFAKAATLLSVNKVNNSITGMLRIYPNPVAYNLELNFDILNLKSNVTLTVYDGLGKLQKTIYCSTSTVKVDIANFHRGIYFLILSDGINSYSARFVKQ